MNLRVRHDTNLHAIAGLVDDRPAEHIFQINRRAFVDPEVYQAEMRHIFEATWVFVGGRKVLGFIDKRGPLPGDA